MWILCKDLWEQTSRERAELGIEGMLQGCSSPLGLHCSHELALNSILGIPME